MSLLANQHPEPAEEEEDISRAGVYHDEPAPSGKGKGKQRAENPFEDDDGESTDEEDEETGEKGYPPVNDEDAEARRVAEVRSLHSGLYRPHFVLALTRKKNPRGCVCM